MSTDLSSSPNTSSLKLSHEALSPSVLRECVYTSLSLGDLALEGI